MYLIILPYHINTILLYHLSIKCHVYSPISDTSFHYPRVLVRGYTALLSKDIISKYLFLFLLFFRFTFTPLWLCEIISDVKKISNGGISFKANLVIKSVLK